MRRIALFLLTNLAVIVVLGVVLRLLGVDSLLNESGRGLNYTSLLIFAGVFGFAPTGHGAPASGVAVAGVLLVVGVVMALVLVALVTLHILAASGLKKRTRRTLTFVASVMMCTSFPLGTALGVWTIMVLGRPGVKALYGVP